MSVLFFLIAVSADFSFYSNVPLWSGASNIIKPVRAGNTASYSVNNNGWLIIVSGRDQNEVITKTVQRYNVNTNSWDTLNPHPTGLLGGATAILKDSLYVIGGIVNPPGAGQSIVYKYSINQNTWSQVADFPTTIVDAKAVSYQDSLIYTGGGFNGQGGGIVYLYNSNSNSWRQATSFPSIGRKSFGGFAITGDTIIYMCGTAAFGSTKFDDSVYVGVISQTDRSVITWTRGANFPGQTRTFFDACNWGGNGIIMTGGSTDNTFNTSSNECYSFSPGRNQWTQLPNKPTSWLTGQSGSVKLPNNIWKLICASGFNSVYLPVNEILTDTLFTSGINNNTEIVQHFTLHQNYPNPFNPNTIISYQLSMFNYVTLKVYDVLGNEVATLVDEKKSQGIHEIEFDGKDLPGGVYFYKLKAGQFEQTKKMLFVK